jgi:hypothetical protein
MALSYADVFITEGGLASLSQKASIKNISKTVVLSVRNPKEILATIQSIVGN